MRAACRLGDRFAVLTAGQKTVPLIQHQARVYGLGARLAKVRAVDADLLDVLGDQHCFEQAFVDAATLAVEVDRAEAVILGGAAFVGMSQRLKNRVAVPLLDPIECAVRQAEWLAHRGDIHR